VFDASLRTPLVYAIAVRYQTPLWRAGALLRAGCMAGFWVLLLWFPHDTWPKGAALLVLGSVGAVTAWAHNRSSLLGLLAARDIPGLGAVARHLLGARQRATIDLSGLLEGFGIISASLLFAGPLGVRPLPATVYALAMVLIVIHVWSAFLQAMTDSTWYATDPPPARALLVLRPLIPLIVAVLLFAILGYPVYWQHQAVPGGLFAAILAAAAVLLLLPYTVIYELILRGARDALVLLARRYRADDAVTVHSLVKNAAYALISEVDGDPGAGPETRALAREMLALTEEARLMVLGRAAELGTVELLWHCVTRTLPSGGETVAGLDPASRSVQLSGTDYQLARRCLVDLVTNAWKAGAHRIEVAISVEEQPGTARTQTVLRVDDDGPGMPAGVLENPATSLAVMAEHLRGYAGSLALSPRAGGGTRACVRWQSAW
jgi:signal transduction histidine kinase